MRAARGREVTRGLDVLTKMEALETRREVRYQVYLGR